MSRIINPIEGRSDLPSPLEEFVANPSFPPFSWLVEGGLPDTIATNSKLDEKNQQIRDKINGILGDEHGFHPRAIGLVVNMLIRPYRGLPHFAARTVEPIEGLGVTFHDPDVLFFGEGEAPSQTRQVLKMIFQSVTEPEA